MTDELDHSTASSDGDPTDLSPTPETTSTRPGPRLIGSQRNPEAYRPKPEIPVLGDGTDLKTETYPPEGDATQTSSPPLEPVSDPEDLEDEEMPDRLSKDGERSMRDLPIEPGHRVQIPRLRHGKLPDDLEDEFNAVFGDESLENLMSRSDTLADSEVLEPDTKVKAKVLSIQGDGVFLDVGAREQGIVSLKMFPPDAEPKIGDVIDVTILRLEDGLYEVSVPMAAADVRDWSQVQEGMAVEAKITKTNSGGLECEVNRLRGFIPISQIDLFRVNDLEPYVGQKMVCIVEEVNPERRNLVLSRRAMLNRERDEMKKKLLDELEVGQIREGLIRKIIDAGAFVDLGGVDGFIPISKISWGRINHPSDVLAEGIRVKVRVDRIEEGTNRISLVYRDDASNPWSNINERFEEKSAARGKVTKTMDFGAFVELMPGVEGLIHISELSHKRVNSVREVVKEGDWVDVFIVSIDPESKRMGLSIKQLTVVPEAEVGPAPQSEGEPAEEGVGSTKGKKNKMEGVAAPVKIKNTHKGPLKGGTGGSSEGGTFGLKW